jgi:hypothetical protein
MAPVVESESDEDDSAEGDAGEEPQIPPESSPE